MILQNMQGNFFMQLLIILALLLYGGKSGAQNLLNEVKPVLESIGGNEMKEALKSAEEISSVLEAVREFTGGEQQQNSSPSFTGAEQESRGDSTNMQGGCFPLEPIANVADKSITYSLSKYVESC